MRVCLAGYSGRMGHAIIKAVKSDNRFSLTCLVGKDKSLNSESGVKKSSDFLDLIGHFDVLIDFSSPELTTQIASASNSNSIIHVIGTTGFNKNQEEIIANSARHNVVVKSGNMSLGANLLIHAVRQISSKVDVDVDIIESHHKYKKDKPSGTALMLKKSLVLNDDKKVSVHSVRAGSVVGEHRVVFSGVGEQLELIHRAENRDVFACGALEAAWWAQGKKPGMFTMLDVIS